jgi:hypothetical protein
MKTKITIDFDSERDNQIILIKEPSDEKPDLVADIIGTCAALCELIDYGSANKIVDKEASILAAIESLNQLR